MYWPRRGVVAWAASTAPSGSRPDSGGVIVGVASCWSRNQALEQIVFGAGLRSSRASGCRLGRRWGSGPTDPRGVDDHGRVERLPRRPRLAHRRGHGRGLRAGGRLLAPASRAGVVSAGSRSESPWLFYAASLGDGLGFLPGLLVASPLAVVGVIVANRRPRFAARSRWPSACCRWSSGFSTAAGLRIRNGAAGTCCCPGCSSRSSPRWPSRPSRGGPSRRRCGRRCGHRRRAGVAVGPRPRLRPRRLHPHGRAQPGGDHRHRALVAGRGGGSTRRPVAGSRPTPASSRRRPARVVDRHLGGPRSPS